MAGLECERYLQALHLDDDASTQGTALHQHSLNASWAAELRKKRESAVA